MKIFQVRHKSSRAILWTGQAETSDRALEVAAQAAGYRAFAELPDNLRIDMKAESVTI